MILCPNCHHEEVSGALFCSECGARLILPDKKNTQFLRRPGLEGTTGGLQPAIPAPGTKPFGVDSIVSLNLLDSNQTINLAGQNVFTLGRSIEGQTILPDVDLTPYEAYAQGVSRLHAQIKIIDHEVFISDLGSSNGTRVNGQKIPPETDVRVNHGDLINLGRLKIQILLRKM
ncbi:MAG TPA: FHA domain-containing protein [Anaerolineaceae bacterium]